MSTQYDKFAEQYKDAALRVTTRQLLEYNLQQWVGDVRGKSVLDLACGSGDFTRDYKRRGAARVVGVDISQEMIKLARQDEAQEPLGIEYIQQDVQTMGKIGTFDVVVAAFLLPYAQTREQLRQMCQTAYVNLKPGERFITLNNNPKMPREDYDQEAAYRKYGVFPWLPGGVLDEGAVVKWTVLSDGHQIEIETYHWSPATYEWALADGGFTDIQWHDLGLPPELSNPEDRAYWQYLMDHPGNIVIEGQKPA